MVDSEHTALGTAGGLLRFKVDEVNVLNDGLLIPSSVRLGLVNWSRRLLRVMRVLLTSQNLDRHMAHLVRAIAVSTRLHRVERVRTVLGQVGRLTV